MSLKFGWLPSSAKYPSLSVTILHLETSLLSINLVSVVVLSLGGRSQFVFQFLCIHSCAIRALKKRNLKTCLSVLLYISPCKVVCISGFWRRQFVLIVCDALPASLSTDLGMVQCSMGLNLNWREKPVRNTRKFLSLSLTVKLDLYC